jgi:glyoxylase-like metal-dependent hydrolase (beta-lactamase superfamily II)
LKLGDLEFHIISDGHVWLDGGAMFGVVPKVLWEKKVNSDAKNRIQLAMNCLLVKAGGKTILVETGAGDKMNEKFRQIYGLDGPFLGHRLREYGLDNTEIDIVINTHLHFDHCGGNRRLAGVPTYVQRAELEAAVEPNYLVDWVHFPGESYVEVDGDADLFDGVSVLFTPGHSAGHQSVVVLADEGLVVLGGDVTYSMQELIDGATPSILRIHELEPAKVYLAHHREPWIPAVR